MNWLLPEGVLFPKFHSSSKKFSTGTSLGSKNVPSQVVHVFVSNDSTTVPVFVAIIVILFSHVNVT